MTGRRSIVTIQFSKITGVLNVKLGVKKVLQMKEFFYCVSLLLTLD